MKCRNCKEQTENTIDEKCFDCFNGKICHLLSGQTVKEWVVVEEVGEWEPVSMTLGHGVKNVENGNILNNYDVLIVQRDWEMYHMIVLNQNMLFKVGRKHGHINKKDQCCCWICKIINGE